MRRVIFLAVVALAGGLGTGCAAVPAAPRKLTPASWTDHNLAIGYLGHASVLIEMSGSFVLTDPVFSDRVGVRIGPLTLGRRRLVAPALPLEELPRLDVVVISHAHFDSLDLPSLRALPKEATLIAPTSCRDLLGDLGFRDYVELAWGEDVTVDGVTVRAVPVSHWGKRVPWGSERGYNGYVFSKNGARVLFASDTAYSKSFARFRDTEDPLDVAIFGNGAYRPWVRNHANPEQVWQMFVESGAHYLVPIHWGTFRLGFEPEGDAMRRLIAAAGPETPRIVIDTIGGEWFLSHEP